MRRELDTSRHRLVVVSNRGPVEHHFGTDNQIVVRRAGGGLVTALSSFRRHHDFSWIASAITPGDHHVARSPTHVKNTYKFGRNLNMVLGSGANDEPLDSVDLVVVPKDVFHNYYDVFSNRVLWFLQHSMWDLLNDLSDKDTICEAWWGGYVPTNTAFADAVAASVKGQKMPVVMLHDQETDFGAQAILSGTRETSVPRRVPSAKP